MKFFFVFFLIKYSTAALDKEWWRHSTIYEIFTPSFKDSNGDGYGDLKGITSKLDYLKDFGVDAIWLTPFFSSPMVDTGYDISDYVGINPLYGTMADFEELVRELHAREMKLIIELVINHSSDQHKWFKKSVNRVHPYSDYYVWHDPKGYNATGHPIAPNNWNNFVYGSSWTWNEKRKQFYYHVFASQQPDLNLRNPRVQNEIKKIIKFWLDKGVAGMRQDAINWLMEDPLFEDEECMDPTKTIEQCPFYQLKREKTMSHPDTFEYNKDLRAYVDELSISTNTYEKILIAEAVGTSSQLKAVYGNASRPGSHFPLNTAISQQIDYLNSSSLNFIIDYWISIIPNITVSNWLIDSHDGIRTSFRLLQEYVDILLTAITLLPGVTVLYYGEEIGMPIGVIRPEHRKLWWSEYSRTPMQWDPSTNAGFTTNKKGWLPVNPNYWRLNVKKEQMNPLSTYNYLKTLLKFKKTKAVKYGNLDKYILSDWVFVIKRSDNYNEHYLAVINLGTEKEIIRLIPKVQNLPAVLTVCLSSANSGLKKG